MNALDKRKNIMDLIDKAIKSGARKIEACKTIDINVRTIERWEKNEIGDKRPFVEKTPINKLSEKEREKIIQICCSERFKDTSPNEIVPILAEEGVYVASESSFYRVLNAENLLKHRTESKVSKKRNKPEELKATGPNQVWSWDITYLLSGIKGMYYYLYMFVDIWSRVIVGWEIHEKESSELSSALMTKICTESQVRGVRLHSDRGGPMKGATMLATLQKLGVIPSFSRPSVSDDNPYSEALFKTLKYDPEYPKSFASIDDAREWVETFVKWYNYEHRHSGIKFVTPMQRHEGEDIAILKKRDQTYRKAQLKNPERWSNKTRNWNRIETVFLNPKKEENLTEKAA